MPFTEHTMMYELFEVITMRVSIKPVHNHYGNPGALDTSVLLHTTKVTIDASKQGINVAKVNRNGNPVDVNGDIWIKCNDDAFYNYSLELRSPTPDFEFNYTEDTTDEYAHFG